MRLALFLGAAGLALAQAGLDFPMSLAPSPDGKYVLALNAGKNPSISVMEAAGTTPPLRELSRVPLEDAWLGLTFAPSGKTVYAGGGFRGSVYELSFSSSGELRRTREFKASDFIGDVAVSPDGRLIYAADLYKNAIVVINPQSGRVIDHFKTGRRPYRILFHPDGKSYFVSSWADATVYLHSVANGEELGRIRLAPHPTDMVLSDYKPPVEEGQPPIPWKYRLYVTAANTNSVFVVGVGENNTLSLVEAIGIAPESMTPLGMTPSALALSPDQKQLYVACSDADVVASVNVSDTRGVLEEYIPTGAYPTAVRVVNQQVIAVNGHAAPAPGPEVLARDEIDARRTSAEHIVYIVPTGSPEATMRAVAGIVPDYTAKFAPAWAAGRKKTNDFDGREPANTPPGGYIWSNARAAGISVKNYGISELGQVLTGTEWTKSLLEDLNQAADDGSLPRLIVIPQTGTPTMDAIRQAIQKSKFGVKTEIVSGDLWKVERLLGLRPMTRTDAGPNPLR
jgi:YVTN family beta-propeller protein